MCIESSSVRDWEAENRKILGKCPLPVHGLMKHTTKKPISGCIKEDALHREFRKRWRPLAVYGRKHDGTIVTRSLSTHFLGGSLHLVDSMASTFIIKDLDSSCPKAIERRKSDL